jgi:hypothetical protein
VPDLTQFRHDVPESLTNLIYRMLEKDRKRRIGSVRLVGAQLEAIMSGLDTGAIEVEGSRFDTTASTLAPSIGPRHNLPPQPTPFVGREPEVLDMVNLLNETDCRLLTLMGPGGMGKTRLAIEVASRKVDDFYKLQLTPDQSDSISPDLSSSGKRFQEYSYDKASRAMSPATFDLQLCVPIKVPLKSDLHLVVWLCRHYL